MEEKVEKLLKIVSQGKEREKKDIEALLKEEHDKRIRNLYELYERKKSEVMKWAEEEKEMLRRRFEMEKSNILHKERLSLKAQLLLVLKEELLKLFKEDISFRERILERLFWDAREKMREEFIVKCSEKDVDLVRKFYNGDLKADETVEDGIVLEAKDGRFRVVADFAEFLETLMLDLDEVVERKAGELE